HLQGIGMYVRAQGIVEYIKNKEVQARVGLVRPISLAMAQQWIKVLGCQRTRTPTGQFVDDHEGEDV
ncbi:hypothetical protein BOTBODRAFT_71697, partial [Botryobasidium botryosum FD-172 SS1]